MLAIDLEAFLNEKCGVQRLAWLLFFAWLAYVPAVFAQTQTSAAQFFGSIANLLAAAPGLEPDQPIQLRNGIITYERIHRSIFIQDATGGLFVSALDPPSLQIGEVVDVTGKLAKDGFSYFLRECKFQKTGRKIVPIAKSFSAKELLSGSFDMCLVNVEGRLMTEVGRAGDALQLNLRSGPVYFRAELFQPVMGNQLDLFPESVVRLTGICTVGGARGTKPSTFRILLRSPADVALVRPPPVLTLDRTLILLEVVTGIALAALAWVFSLRYQVRRKTEAIQTLNDTLARRVDARTADLAQANKELEAFSYSISHDLKAPLRAIRNFSQFLGEDHAQSLPEEGQRFVKLINEGAQRMDRLIEDLLLFSRLSRAPLQRQTVNINQLLLDCFEEAKAVEPARVIEFELKNLPAANGDPALLRQVFLNLLSNSVKYTRPRAEARIEAGVVLIGGETAYYIKDNGVGFDMKYKDKLFGVFQRLHSVEEFEGTGAGLAIVQQIVKRHGGRVWGESVLNSGATFFVIIGAQKNPADILRA